MSDIDLPLAVRMMQDGYLMEIDKLKAENASLKGAAQGLGELCDQLKTENVELRKERDALDRLTDVLDATNDRLLAENAKLRELVRELYDELDAATQYDAGGGRGVVHEFSDRMRELGVEV